MYPYNVPRGGFFKIFKGMNFTDFLDGAQKTLGVVNQTIPLIYQVKPIINNAKTMFKIADVINEKEPIKEEVISNTTNINKPIFYI